MDRFVQDLKRRELFPIKILMFLIYGGQSTLYPYFTVHLKSLGVSLEHTSIIFAVQPIVALIVAPLFGFIADRIGNFKLMFCFFLAYSATTANLLLLVPSVHHTPVYYTFSCRSEDSFVLNRTLSSNCNLDPQVSLENMNIVISDCDSTCYRDFCFSNNGSASCNVTVRGNQTLKTSMNGKVTFEETLHSRRFSKFTYEKRSYERLTCTANELQPNCEMICRAKIHGDASYCVGQSGDNQMTVFWYYLGIRLAVTFGIGMVNGLFDAATMTVVQQCDADVGFQRLWSTISMCVMAPISGALVDYVSDGPDSDNYFPCFIMYGILYMIAAVVAGFVDLTMVKPSNNGFKKGFKEIFGNIETDLMLFHIALLGIGWGFLENFLFWFLDSELGSTTLLLGLTVTVGSGTGIPMALVSTWVTRKIGYVNVMVVAFLAYVVRFLGYSYAENAYICLIYETMENFTVTLLTVGVTMYCTKLAPDNMLTTMMTLWNSLHVISGRAFGSLIGGFLMSKLGPRPTFRLFAYSSAFLCAFYFFVNIFYLQKRKATLLEEKDSNGTPSSEDGSESRDRSISNTSAMICWMGDSFLLTPPTFIPKTDDSPRRHSHVPLTYNTLAMEFSLEELRRSRSRSLHFEPLFSPRPVRSRSPSTCSPKRGSSIASQRPSLPTVHEEVASSNNPTIVVRVELHSPEFVNHVRPGEKGFRQNNIPPNDEKQKNSPPRTRKRTVSFPDDDSLVNVCPVSESYL